jgi:shikimate kinase
MRFGGGRRRYRPQLSLYVGRHMSSLIIVLMGASGSGKTYIGRLLGSFPSFVFVEIERALVRRYGSRDSFIMQKEAALVEVEREVRFRAEDSSVPIVIEASGLSDGPMLRRLCQDFRVLLVKVSASRQLCIERVSTRKRGENLSNDASETGPFYDFWAREVEPLYRFDLEIESDGNDDAETSEMVLRLVAKACSSTE